MSTIEDPHIPEKIRARDRDALVKLGEAESLFEFRRDAHDLYDDNTIGSVKLDIYLTWAGLGGAGAFFIMGLYGVLIGTRPKIVTGALWLTAVSLVFLLLVLKRIRRRFRSAALVRETIRDQSWTMDIRAESGDLPTTPPDWSVADGMPTSPGDRPNYL